MRKLILCILLYCCVFLSATSEIRDFTVSLMPYVHYPIRMSDQEDSVYLSSPIERTYAKDRILKLPIYKPISADDSHDLKVALDRFIIAYRAFIKRNYIQDDSVSLFLIDFEYQNILKNENLIGMSFIILTPSIYAELLHNKAIEGVMPVADKDGKTFLFLMQNMNDETFDLVISNYCESTSDIAEIYCKFERDKPRDIFEFFYEGYIERLDIPCSLKCFCFRP